MKALITIMLLAVVSGHIHAETYTINSWTFYEQVKISERPPPPKGGGYTRRGTVSTRVHHVKRDECLTLYENSAMVKINQKSKAFRGKEYDELMSGGMVQLDAKRKMQLFQGHRREKFYQLLIYSSERNVLTDIVTLYKPK